MDSYKKLCTEFYDIDKPNAPVEALAFYSHYAHQAGGLILEPMCGSGRFLLPLLEQGFSIEGMDASSDMLQACRENGRRRGLAPDLCAQFLHQLELPKRYDLVIIPGASFCLITDPLQIQESLRRLHVQMKPRATLVLDILRLMPQPPPEEFWSGRWVNRTDGGKIVISTLSHYDPTKRVSHNLHRYESIKDGQWLETEWEEIDLRFYEAAEFSALLESAGFTAVKTFKAYGHTLPDDSDDIIVFDCIRP